jgi:hypothetical protein
MTKTQAPPPIFSPDEPLEALWIRSYQGEVLGEILFAGIAAQVGDPEQARKMRVLSTLERKTKEAIVPALERAGISTDPDPGMVSAAEALVEATASVPWLDVMGSFEAITTQYTALYVRIGELDPAERETSELLVAHEQALQEFGRRELAGDGAGSLTRIEALPHLQ